MDEAHVDDFLQGSRPETPFELASGVSKRRNPTLTFTQLPFPFSLSL
jgi:hypothetical protein